MENPMLIESLDSLWFFTNILSSSIPKPISIVSEDHVEEITKSDPSKPTTPILQIQFPIDEIAAEDCPKCADFEDENEESRETEEREEEEEEKRERRIRKRRRLKSDFDTRRRVVNWLDFGFDLNEIDEFCMMMMMMDDGKSKGCKYADDDDGKGMMKMPSFSDGMAMREHLKSWAYSVACAVK